MIERLHAHREWANQRMLEWILALPQQDEYCLKMFSHILLAEDNVLRRMRAEAPGDSWQLLAPEELSSLYKANNAAWHKELQTDLDRKIRYRLLDGTDTESIASDLAIHICTHGVYHRGQIAAQAARIGLHVPSTDFIVFTRSLA